MEVSTGTANSNEGARVTPTWDVSVISYPPNSYSGDVDAELKGTFKWSGFAEIIESKDAHGDTMGVAVNVFSLTFNFPGSGTKDICGAFGNLQPIFDDIESDSKGDFDFSSNDIIVDPNESLEIESISKDSSISPSWETKTFTVGSSTYQLDVEIAIGTKTTKEYGNSFGNREGTSLREGEMKLKSIKLEEHDNEFQIK